MSDCSCIVVKMLSPTMVLHNYPACACAARRVSVKPGLWTLDSGLDSWTGLWTEIWTRFWTDAQFNDDHFQETVDRWYYNCKLVTSSLVPRPFKGLDMRLVTRSWPEGYL